jgi:hypothetical protein
MKAPRFYEDYSCTAGNVYRQRETLATALRAMLGAYCGQDGQTREDCEAAEQQAREALARIEEATE